MNEANAGTPRGQTLHGARAYLVVDGKMIGYVQTVDGNTAWSIQPLECLDNLEVQEHVVTGYTVQFNVGKVQLVGVTLKSLGITRGLDDILLAGDLTIEVKDRPTDTPIMTFEGCVAQSESFNVTKGALSVQRVSFMAKRARDSNGVV